MTVQGTRPSVASGFSLHGFVNNVPLKLLATIFLDEASPHSKVSKTFLSHFPRAFLQKRSSGRQRNKYNLHLDLIGPYKVGFSWNFDEDEDNVLPVGTDLVLGQDFLNLPNIQFFPHERYLKLNNSIINFAGNLLDTFWVKQHMETAFPYITTFTSNDENVGLKTCIAFSAEKNFISFDCLGKLPFYRAGRERYNGLYQYKFPLFIKDDKGFYNQRLKEESEKRKSYSESRKNNRKKKDMSNICKTYEQHMENENENENINKDEIINKSKYFKKEDFKEIPEHITFSVIQRYKLSNDKTITDKQVSDMWEVFKDQNLTGDKFYNNENEVYKHFVNWINKQKFDKNAKPTTAEDKFNAYKEYANRYS